MLTNEELLRGWCKTNVDTVYEEVDHDDGIPKMAAVKDLRWDVGSTIYIKFLDGDSTYNDTIKAIANVWTTNLANIKFSWLGTNQQAPAGVDPLSVVRITLRNEATAEEKGSTPGSWSYIGTQLKDEKDLSKPTMNFDMSTIGDKMAVGQYGYGTVLHEFGHMLALNHEQLRPDRTIQFDEEEAYKYYQQANMGSWDEDTVKFNILRIEKGMVGTTEFDPHSIMMYWFPNEILSALDPTVKKSITEGRYSEDVLVYPENNVLSAMDQEWIKVFYPMPGQEKPLNQIDR